MKLMADDEFVKTIRIDNQDGNEWTFTESGLPKYAKAEGEEEPHEIEYTFEEYEIEGYELSNEPELKKTGENTWEIEFENKHIPETVEITVEKEWEDEDDQDGVRPESITVTLLADGETATAPESGESDGEAFEATVELTAEGEWTYTWNGLPKNKAGKAIAYTIDEVTVEGYESETAEIVETGENTYKIVVTNKHIPKTTEIEVKEGYGYYREHRYQYCDDDRHQRIYHPEDPYQGCQGME